MADDDVLYTRMELRVREFDKQLARLNKNVDAAMGGIERRTQKAAKTMESSLASAGSRMAGVIKTSLGGLAAGFAAGVSLQAASQFVDASKNITNALKVAGLEGEGLTKVYDRLFASAQRNAAPIDALITLYSRAAGSARELNASQEDLLRFSDKVAVALKVSGQSAGEASGALLQLSQLLGGGAVQMEEFGSLLDGGRPILQAVAAGMAETGGSVAKLTALVKDGKVSSEAFFRAFLAGAATLDEKVAGAATTTSQRFVQLQNVLIDTAGKIDGATGASDRFGATIEDLATTIQQFGNVVVNASDSQLGTFVGWLSDGIDAASEFKKVMGGLPGIMTKMGQLNQDMFKGQPLGSAMKAAEIQTRIDRAFESTKAAPKTGRLAAAPPPVAVAPVKPVSLADYPIPEEPKAPKAPKKKRVGRGSGEPKLDDFAREIASIKERTASLNAAYAAQASLNPLISDYGYTVDKARAAQDLLAASMAAGKAQTPALAREIDAAAESYARATSAAERLAAQQEKIRDDAKAAGDAIGDVLTDTVMTAIKGGDIGKAFADALVGRTVSIKMEFSK
jgi:tape measure domain-containing protein